MITLALDTCESRGSVAVRRDGRTVAMRRHESAEDYSSWLLPNVREVLRESGVGGVREVELFAAATGPGSFTGLRVGLTTVKAWVELFGTNVVGVSRLQAMVRAAGVKQGLVAVSVDAQRGQVFGGLYDVGEGGEAALLGEELVIAPGDFVEWAAEQAGARRLTWVSPDPGLVEGTGGWKPRGEESVYAEPWLAGVIGELGEEKARYGELSDALRLDANYVRRSDAEIFWKG